MTTRGHRRPSRRRDAPLVDLRPLLVADDRPVGGVEHEYRVRRDAEVVDFRTVVDALGVGRRLDPGDPHAHRGAWGGVVTADGREAEVATPPVVLEPGFAVALHAWAARGRAAVVGGGGLELEGYSTHVSVEVDDRIVCRAADLFTPRFASAMMLMLDRVESPGLLVRPRRSRLELCGEFVDGDALVAAVVFATGASLACAAAATDRRARRLLPPAVRLQPERAVERFGTYVDRACFGTDLYEHGRRSVLRTGRSTTTAQEHLEAAWASARRHVVACTTPDELALVDAVVAGDRPLPLEAGVPPAPGRGVASLHDATASTYRGLVDTRLRPTFSVEAQSATWDVTVFRLAADDATLFVTIPRRHLGAFVAALDAGRLDAVLDDALHAGDDRRVARVA
jgi:hypothetical protein